MATVQTLIDNIKDDFQRGDIDTRILAAINAAHRHYEGEQTWFNETTASFTTTSSQGSYGTADGFPQYVNKIRLVTLAQNSSNVFPLEPISFEKLYLINTSPTTTLGLPGQYAFYNNALLLYTTPDGAYPVHVYYIRAYGELSANEQTVWIDNAQDLIESRASYWLASRVTMEPERAQAARMLEVEALNRIREKSNALAADVIRVRHSDWW